jgi:hypothetical protein
VNEPGHVPRSRGQVEILLGRSIPSVSLFPTQFGLVSSVDISRVRSTKWTTLAAQHPGFRVHISRHDVTTVGKYEIRSTEDKRSSIASSFRGSPLSELRFVEYCSENSTGHRITYRISLWTHSPQNIE